MTQKRILWREPSFGDAETRALVAVMRSGYINEGDRTEEFERRVARLCGVPYAVGVTSGTAAITLGLMACGVGPGDDVIVPAFTFIATANAVRLAGARPVLVDIRLSDLNIDPERAARAVTRRTRAIVPVHISGRSAPMRDLMRLARARGLAVVEDAAEALGSRRGGVMLGSKGHAAAFSFAGTKLVTTGQGGVVVTRSAAVHRRLRQLKDQGRARRGTGGDDLHPVVGYNFKLTNLQSAVGVAQLARLPARLDRMRALYRLYARELEACPQVRLVPFDLADGAGPQWVDALVERRDALAAALDARGIETRRFWLPLHRQRSCRSGGRFPAAEAASRSGLWLPSSVTMSDREALRVCREIRAFYGRAGA